MNTNKNQQEYDDFSDEDVEIEIQLVNDVPCPRCRSNEVIQNFEDDNLFCCLNCRAIFTGEDVLPNEGA